MSRLSSHRSGIPSARARRTILTAVKSRGQQRHQANRLVRVALDPLTGQRIPHASGFGWLKEAAGITTVRSLVCCGAKARPGARMTRKRARRARLGRPYW